MATQTCKTNPISRRRALQLAGAASLAMTALGSSAASAAISEELTWMPAWRIRDLIVDRQVTALEVTNHFLALIARLDPRRHAFRNYAAEAARRQARAADQQLADGRPAGLLHGAPVGVKDHIAVRGLPLGAGADSATRDSVVVERLRSEGAVIVGTLVSPGMGVPAGQSLENHPRNPWNQRRVPGSSSAGPAAAVNGARKTSHVLFEKRTRRRSKNMPRRVIAGAWKGPLRGPFP